MHPGQLRPGRSGFTLIELLIVIAIIGVLMAMLMPVYGVVKRTMQRNATECVLKKVEIGLRLFRIDLKVLPGQLAYPASAANLDNRLYYHVGTDIDPAQRSQVLLDATEAGNLFAYQANGGASPSEIAAQPSPLTYTQAISGASVARAAILNRMARDRSRLAAISGNLWLAGPVIATDSAAAAIVQDKRATRVFPAPHSAAEPGWACDYLAGELEARFRSGQSIRDAWGRPLAYICQQIPGILGTSSSIWQGWTYVRFNKAYGLGPIGFDPTQGPGPAIATTRPHLLYGGRIILSRLDAGDGKGPTPTDATCFPSTANLLGSDVRYYATVRFARDFELWSGGPDQRFEYMRDDPANRDNLSATPYNRDF